MIIEEAQVVGIENNYALLRTHRHSACGHCDVSGGCGLPVLSKVFGRGNCQLRLENHADARMGDIVRIGIQEGGLLKSAIILYMLPLLSVLFANVIGVAVLGFSLTDLIAVILSVFGFALGVLCAKLWSRLLVNKPEYQTKIISVVSNDDRKPITFHHHL